MLTSVEGSRYVMAASMVGAVGGGFWLGFAFEVLAASDGGLLDLAALLLASLLTLALAWMVFRGGGRRALLVYLVVAGVAATVGPALVF